MIELTDAAWTLMRVASTAARRFVPDAGIRIAAVEEVVRFGLADAPLAGDLVLERDDIRLFVASDLDGVVDVVEPHGTLVLRPALM